MAAATKPTEKKTVLHFAFLVYREESERWGAIWTARSVLTGHVAEGQTPDSAVGNLQRSLDASIYMARELGQSPQEWYAAQEPDEVEHLTSFIQLVGGDVQRRTFTLKGVDCELETSIATCAA